MIRFPKPDFESGYVLPETQTVAARAAGWETLDVVLLLLYNAILLLWAFVAFVRQDVTPGSAA